MKLRFLLCAVLFFVCWVPNIRVEAKEELPAVLSGIQRKVNLVFNEMDADLDSAARELSRVGLTGPDARKILQRLYQSNPNIVDCSTIDLKGKLVAVEPSEYQKFEGSDISRQEQVIELHKTKKPVFSRVFRSVEGFNAADFSYPVFSAQNELMGSVSVLFKPEEILAGIVLPLVHYSKAEAWVMQKDGLIVYDQNPEEVGKNVFTDKIYQSLPQFIAFSETVANQEKGSGTYEFLAKGLKIAVKKEGIWATVSFKGTQWRVVAVEVVDAGVPREIDLLIREEQDAIIKNEVQTAVSLLQAIYNKHKKGEIRLAEAKRLAVVLLRDLRYGDKQEGYFWADTAEGVNVVLYGNKSVEGKNRYNANIKGIYYIREIIAKGMRPGGGFTDYWFPKKGRKEPLAKRGYSLFFKPFNWVVGTGYYLEDVDKLIAARTKAAK